MRVKCIADTPSDEQARELGEYYHTGKEVFHLTVGKEDIVYGLSFLGGTPWVLLRSESGYIVSTPLCLFEITDGQVSRYWHAACDKRGMMFWPPSFYREYYFDDLIEGVPGVVDDFRQVRAMIESEARAEKKNANGGDSDI